MTKTLYNIPILINFKGEKGSLDLASPRSFHCVGPPKIFVVENALYFPIGIVKMRKDASFWRTIKSFNQNEAESTLLSENFKKFAQG